VRLASESLALARDLGTPTLITHSTAALAGALVDHDPERAQALLRESIQLRASLDYENWQELTEAVLISARLGDWPQTLALASRSIRHLHWSGGQPLLGAIFNVIARALTPTNTESAAVLQGAARHLTPPTPVLDTSTQSHSAAARSPPAVPADRSSSTTGFVTELRRETTGLLRDTLGQEPLRELRAKGEAMNADEAVAYALDVITHTQHIAQQ
jgi:hypothetical protein